MATGLVLSALSGLGSSVAQSAQDYQRVQDQEQAETRRLMNEQILNKQRSDLNVEANKRIAEAEESRKNAPLQRFAKVAQGYLNKEVPVTENIEAPATVDPEAKFNSLVSAITNVESGGAQNPNAVVSPQGAVGSMQITPATFQDYAKPGEKFENEADRVAAATRKLRSDFDFYGGDVAKTAAAYIGGRGAVTPEGEIRADVKDALGTTPAAYADKVNKQVSDILAANAPEEVPTEPKQVGKRKLTSDEAAVAALEELRTTDPVAFKAARDALKSERVHIGQGGALIDELTGKVLYKNTTAQEIAEGKNKAAADRLDKQIAAKERMAEMKFNQDANKKTVEPAAVEAAASQIATYAAKPLGDRVRSTPFGQQVLARVRELNPNYSDIRYGEIDKATKAFATGKQGDIARSLNVAIDHIGTAEGLIDALNNGDVNLINKLGNKIAAETGSTAPTNFEAVKHIVADEITKSVVGGPGALADREQMAETIRSSNSPQQIRGVLTQFKSLMRGQLDGLSAQYERTTGNTDFEDRFLSPAARAAFHGAGTQTAAAPNVPARVPNPVAPQAGGARPSLDQIFAR